MRRLVGRIQPYAWGSRTEIATLRGRPAPTPQPEAELWLGAHPDAPSLLDGEQGKSLCAEIEADPIGLLGTASVARFGPRLPFLLKLLAVDQPLSLQVHPDAAQARAGYAAEEAAGVPKRAPGRNYADPYHKPELLVAVTDFDALCGFRPVAGSLALLRRLDLPALAPVVDRLRLPDPRRALREAVTEVFALPPATVREVREACLRHSDRPEYAMAAELAKRYPEDLGVVVSLLLNLVHLAPGEAVYMPAGNPHTYLRGVGVEAMAASDNVLRGGLTPKHVDVPELLRVLRYEELPEPKLAAVPAGQAVCWPTPPPDFRLTRATVAGSRVRLPARAGARIVCCLAGTVEVGDTVARLRLGPGEAGIGAAGGGALTIDGDGEVFEVCTGPDLASLDPEFLDSR